MTFGKVVGPYRRLSPKLIMDPVTVATAIDREICLGLLSGATFGRIALNVAGGPRIVPVRFAVHRGRISAHMQGRVDIGDALDDAEVALQADGFDDETQLVWSVHVVGRVTARHDSGFAITPTMIEGEWLAF